MYNENDKTDSISALKWHESKNVNGTKLRHIYCKRSVSMSSFSSFKKPHLYQDFNSNTTEKYRKLEKRSLSMPSSSNQLLPLPCCACDESDHSKQLVYQNSRHYFPDGHYLIPNSSIDKLMRNHAVYSSSFDAKETGTSEKIFNIWISVLFFLSFFLVFLSYCVQLRVCNLKSNFNITEVNRTLHNEVYGQDASLEIMFEVLNRTFSTQSMSLMLFIGSTGTGKSLVASLLSHHFPLSSVHEVFESSELFSSIWNYREGRLKEWISTNTNRCGPTLFIFDGIDENKKFLVQELKSLVEEWPSLKKDVSIFPIVFILISNTNSWHIVNTAVEMSKSDVKRNKVLEVIHYLKNDSLSWYWTLQNLKNFHFIPFFPLHKNHVKLCIKKYMLKNGLGDREEDIDHVANQMDYFPKDNSVFSKTGCKLVSTKIKLSGISLK